MLGVWCLWLPLLCNLTLVLYPHIIVWLLGCERRLERLWGIPCAKKDGGLPQTYLDVVFGVPAIRAHFAHFIFVAFIK